MKIEITDREMWLRRAQSARDNIKHLRQLADINFVETWRNNWNRRSISKWLGKRSETDFPTEDWIDGYPSCIGEWGLDRIESVISALETKGTGRIYLEARELEAIKGWEK